jgi:HEPN domain-containing protein
MTLTMLGQGLRGSGLRGGLVRASKALVVQVSEPPAGPRPAGYMLGDVGSFSLQAQVEPRKIEAGGSVAVTATVRGTGNPPTALRLPERKGVTWLEPETREVVDSGDGVVGGSRTFTYLVKITEPGKVDLGELSVSFWNPKLKEYQVSRARLGSIDVAPGATPAASASAAPAEVDPFAAVGPARAAPGPYAPPGEMLADRPWFWFGLAGAPLSVLLAQGASGALGQLRRRRREQDESAATRARRALQEARAAEAKGDPREAAASAERALVAVVEAAFGVKLRALRAHEVKPALVEAGAPPEQADEVSALLSACEQERFLPPGEAPSSSLVSRVEPLLKGLLR